MVMMLRGEAKPVEPSPPMTNPQKLDWQIKLDGQTLDMKIWSENHTVYLSIYTNRGEFVAWCDLQESRDSGPVLSRFFAAKKTGVWE